MTRYLVNPLLLFLAVWGTAVALYAGRRVRGDVPGPSPLLWAAVLLNVGGFSLGYLTWAAFRRFLPPAEPALSQARVPQPRTNRAHASAHGPHGPAVPWRWRCIGPRSSLRSLGTSVPRAADRSGHASRRIRDVCHRRRVRDQLDRDAELDHEQPVLHRVRPARRVPARGHRPPEVLLPGAASC